MQISYAIGEAKPVSVTVDTQGTGKTQVSDERLSHLIREHYPLTPKWIKEKFKLDQPSEKSFLYADIAAKGQVGLNEYPWEQLDSLEQFNTLIKVAQDDK